MKFFSETKGAVSIFLILILLPVMTVAGLFLDVSRVSLSQEVVSSSADLALNTVLSNYDKTLKNYFGLLASCQDANEVLELSKQYFADSMVSAGVATSDAEILADKTLSAFVGDEDIRDFLRLSVDGDVKITPTENGALNNPALVKKGIIEFMKYRAPINGVASLFEKIKKSEVSEQLQNASKETDMTEKKKLFYEAEEKLIQQAKDAYTAIQKYENFATWTGKKISNKQFVQDMSSFLASPDGSGKTFEAVFKDAHQKMVLNLYNTHQTDGALSISLVEQKTIANPGTISTYSDSKRASAGAIQDLLVAFNTALKNYASASASLDGAWSSVGHRLTTDYPIQYWVALTNACATKYADYANQAAALWKAAARLENAVDYPVDGAMQKMMKKADVLNDAITFDTPENGNLPLQSVYDSLTDYYKTKDKKSVTGGGSESFRNITNQIVQINTSANKDKLKLQTVSHIYNIRNKVNQYQNDFNKAFTLAKDAKDKTNKLKKLLDDYKTAFAEWKKVANDSELDDSDLAKEDRKVIRDLEKTGIELFSKDSVTQLAGRLENIQTLCKTFRDDLKAIQYKKTAVKDISGYKEFRSAAGLDLKKIVRTESALKQYAADSFSFSIGSKIQHIKFANKRTSTALASGDDYVITDSFHPDIKNTKLELYQWMEKQFSAPAPSGAAVSASQVHYDVNDEDSAKDAKSDISSRSESDTSADTSENTTGKNFKDWDGATLPSKGESAVEEQTLSAKLSEVSSYVSSILSDFSGTFMNSLVNMRDDLYAVDYIFSMFTYDTFDNEGCFAQLDKTTQKKLTASKAKDKYSSVLSKWKSSNKNKTLTLIPRNASNNWAYGGEAEYILYGSGSNEKNKTTAYSRIYMIRYALDLPVVFRFYWNDTLITMLASALQAFAHIPARLTKTLVCLVITGAEAAVDINSIRTGIPVVLIKQKEDLVCNYKNVFFDEPKSEQNSGNRLALQYSDYLKIFLYIKLVGKDENVMYTRTADVIQTNMTRASGNKLYALSKAHTYYDFNATVLIEPMWSRLLAIDRLGDLSSSKGWRSVEINMRRGY